VKNHRGKEATSEDQKKANSDRETKSENKIRRSKRGSGSAAGTVVAAERIRRNKRRGSFPRRRKQPEWPRKIQERKTTRQRGKCKRRIMATAARWNSRSYMEEHGMTRGVTATSKMEKRKKARCQQKRTSLEGDWRSSHEAKKEEGWRIFPGGKGAHTEKRTVTKQSLGKYLNRFREIPMRSWFSSGGQGVTRSKCGKSGDFQGMQRGLSCLKGLSRRSSTL